MPLQIRHCLSSSMPKLFQPPSRAGVSGKELLQCFWFMLGRVTNAIHVLVAEAPPRLLLLLATSLKSLHPHDELLLHGITRRRTKSHSLAAALTTSPWQFTNRFQKGC